MPLETKLLLNNGLFPDKINALYQRFFNLLISPLDKDYHKSNSSL